MQVNGKELAVEVEGDGPAVLLVHGLGGTSNFYQVQTDALVDRFRVIRVDSAGAGRSPATLRAPEKKITGRTGRMHGDIPVIRPPTKPMITRVNMPFIRSRVRRGSVRVCFKGVAVKTFWARVSGGARLPRLARGRWPLSGP